MSLGYEELPNALVDWVLRSHARIPATVQAFPQWDLAHAGKGLQDSLLVQIQGVAIEIDLAIGVGPQRDSPLFHFFLGALSVTVTQQKNFQALGPDIFRLR